jgi:hypothetical protein
MASLGEQGTFHILRPQIKKVKPTRDRSAGATCGLVRTREDLDNFKYVDRIVPPTTCAMRKELPAPTSRLLLRCCGGVFTFRYRRDQFLFVSLKIIFVCVFACYFLENLVDG